MNKKNTTHEIIIQQKIDGFWLKHTPRLIPTQKSQLFDTFTKCIYNVFIFLRYLFFDFFFFFFSRLFRFIASTYNHIGFVICELTVVQRSTAAATATAFTIRVRVGKNIKLISCRIADCVCRSCIALAYNNRSRAIDSEQSARPVQQLLTCSLANGFECEKQI